MMPVLLGCIAPILVFLILVCCVNGWCVGTFAPRPSERLEIEERRVEMGGEPLEEFPGAAVYKQRLEQNSLARISEAVKRGNA